MGKRKRTWNVSIEPQCPKWIRSVRLVKVADDLFALSRDQIDYAFAVFSSNGDTLFRIRTQHRDKAASYFTSVEKRSKGAADKYERKMRAHFRRYKMRFLEGYSLPGPPTPELRLIYDSAATIERRPTNPNGTTLRSGFSGGEYHWRSWPLSNVEIEYVSEAV